MKTVLIVDDEFAALEVLALLLEGEGYRALKAPHGGDAWEILAREMVDLVISDIDMPVMDGLELVERMRADERTRSIPIILVSGNGRRRHVQLGPPVGTVLPKPVIFDRLLALVQSTLR